MSISVKWISLVLFLCQGVMVSSNTNFNVKKVESCSKDNSTKFYAKVTTENKAQYLDFDITLPRALDETVGIVANIQTSLNGKTFIPVFTIREKNLCKAANNYLGEFWYDIQRSAQMPANQCPVPQRRYYAHHHLMQYDKITLQTFPFGPLRITWNAIENNSKSKDVLFCILMEIENLPN